MTSWEGSISVDFYYNSTTTTTTFFQQCSHVDGLLQEMRNSSALARELRLYFYKIMARWRHQMETFSALLALCAGNSPVPGEFPSQRPVTRSFDVFFNLHLNKRLSKQSWGWWFETPVSALWRHCNGYFRFTVLCIAVLPSTAWKIICNISKSAYSTRFS